MDAQRHKTLKKVATDEDLVQPLAQPFAQQPQQPPQPTQASTISANASVATTAFANLLEDSAREAYARPWHRIERGLRLNRLRIFVEEMVAPHNMTAAEKENFFVFLQKALDKKLLNTLKVVNYDIETQRITAIKGLEVKRSADGILKWGFSMKKKPVEGTTRKKKKDETTSQVTPQATQATQATDKIEIPTPL
jgi:hypothetical protein